MVLIWDLVDGYHLCFIIYWRWEHKRMRSFGGDDHKFSFVPVKI